MDISEFKKAGFSYYQRHPWEIVRAKIIRHLIKKNEKRFPHVLDVGSGDAYVLNDLCRHDIADNYTAIDTAYEPSIIDKIRSTIPCNVNFTDRFPQKLQPPANLVLLLDVLEHCKEEREVLQNINDTSEAEFRIIITVPAFQFLFSKHDELLLHYRRYTVKQLVRLCEGEKWRIEQAGYFFFSLTVVRCVQLILEITGLWKPHKTIDNWNQAKWITTFFTWVLWADYKIGRFLLLLGIRLPGLSAYCICRPSVS